MENVIKKGLSDYEEWRGSLKTTLINYQSWLKEVGSKNSVNDLRIYDHIDLLNRDQLVIALLAEFSRGKTETINALFFSDFDQRLLPSEPGRTTMCPTEILWNPKNEPSITLLPIETRKTDDSITYLKTTPNAWKSFRLNIHSASEMRDFLQKLTEQKQVTLDEATKLGLWNHEDLTMKRELETTGLVHIPVWRHAIVNYPHPMLESGLIILDTPGLNALGVEPELTFNVIQNAHVVLFLMACDTGVTQSDLQIWNQFIKDKINHKIAVLNKVDVLWDGLHSDAKIKQNIEKQVLTTAHQLNLSPESVFAVSAQKALFAKIRKEDDLLARSNFSTLEAALSNNILVSKQSIIGKSIYGDCNRMLKESRSLIQSRLTHANSLVQELRSSMGSEKDSFKGLLADVISQKKQYEAAIPSFNEAYKKIEKLGKKLLVNVGLSNLEETLEDCRNTMGSSWTTYGLNQSMRTVMKKTTAMAEDISKQSKQIQSLAENVYKVLHSKHGFDLSTPPELEVSNFLAEMQNLSEITDEFCADPLNVLTEKRFLIRRFFVGLGAEAQRLFKKVEIDCENWVNQVLESLKIQLEEHKAKLDKRTKVFVDAQKNYDSLKKQMELAEDDMAHISEQAHQLDLIMLSVIRLTKPQADSAKTEVLNAPTLALK